MMGAMHLPWICALLAATTWHQHACLQPFPADAALSFERLCGPINGEGRGEEGRPGRGLGPRWAGQEL